MGGRRIVDLKNIRFGRLIVLERNGLSKSGSIIWKCLCDCGNIKNIVSSSLVRGYTNSCGCLQRELSKKRKQLKVYSSETEASWMYRFSQYKRNANFRKIEFELSFEEFYKISNENCFYCNHTPEERPSQKGRISVFSSGIDRVDNGKGYFLENVVPCCTWCNMSKSNHTSEEFIKNCSMVYKNFNIELKTDVLKDSVSRSE